jgi:hypothetical protein
VVRRQGDKRVYNGTTHEIGVIFAEDEVSSVLIYRITDVKVADKRGTEKTGDIGVIHSICCLKLLLTSEMLEKYIPDP